MDLYCQKCSEPYDLWYVQNDMDDDEENDGPNGERPSKRFKKGDGCPACHWGKDAPQQPNLRAQAMAVTMELLGDDIDGAASMMDDFEFMGMLDEEEMDEEAD